RRSSRCSTVEFFNQLTFDLKHLCEFVRTIGEFRFCSAEMHFDKDFVSLIVDPDLERNGTYPLVVQVKCQPLDWQATCAVQICDALKSLLVRVDSLTLGFYKDDPALWQDEIDHAQWHRLLQTFAGVKSLQLTGGLLLPELRELVPRGWGHTDDAFTSFISARQSAGRRIRMVRN
ncbi:hypothetical protein EDB86DRAFT_2939204, partial [Lactarius hatsudake]